MKLLKITDENILEVNAEDAPEQNTNHLTLSKVAPTTIDKELNPIKTSNKPE